MKRKFRPFLPLYVMLLFAAQVQWVSAGVRPVSDFFTAMPEEVLPTLTKVNRADLVDFMKNNMPARVKNRLGGETTLTTMGQTLMCLQLSSACTWQLKLLKRKDGGTLLMVINTVCAGASESNVTFYDAQWHPIDGASLLSLPTATGSMWQIVAEEGTQDLQLISTDTRFYQGVEQAEQTAGTPSILMRWDGKAFVRRSGR